MATKTLTEIGETVLEALGVKPAGQSANAEDTDAAEDAVTSAYDRLRYLGRAPFDLATVPSWAWTPLRDFAARDLVNVFGITGERLQAVLAAGARADIDFAQQSAGTHDPRVVTTAKYY